MIILTKVIKLNLKCQPEELNDLFNDEKSYQFTSLYTQEVFEK
jgi:hypothetical protein